MNLLYSLREYAEKDLKKIKRVLRIKEKWIIIRTNDKLPPPQFYPLFEWWHMTRIKEKEKNEFTLFSERICWKRLEKVKRVLGIKVKLNNIRTNVKCFYPGFIFWLEWCYITHLKEKEKMQIYFILLILCWEGL